MNSNQPEDATISLIGHFSETRHVDDFLYCELICNSSKSSGGGKFYFGKVALMAPDVGPVQAPCMPESCPHSAAFLFRNRGSIFILRRCAPFPSNWEIAVTRSRSRRGLLKQLGSECARLKSAGAAPSSPIRTSAKNLPGPPMNSLVRAGFEASLIIVPAGETAKSLKSVQCCYDRLAGHRLERKSFIVALGGGVVGISRDLWRRLICAVSLSCKCRRRCWLRWTVPSAARPASICGPEKILLARFTSRTWCCAISMR